MPPNQSRLSHLQWETPNGHLCSERIIYVDDDTANDPLESGSQSHPFDAIQEAIDVARDYDIVIVSDGTYTGVGNRDIRFNGKAIAVRSEGGPEDCIVDCQGNGRGFIFDFGESPESVLDGFQIINGRPQSDGAGGGILIVNSNPHIKNCQVRDNFAECASGLDARSSTFVLDNMIQVTLNPEN